MRILGIDPGPETSGFVLYDADEHAVVTHGSEGENSRLERWITAVQGGINIDDGDFDLLVVEDIQNYGKIVGTDVFETLKWIGRFDRAWQGDNNNNPDGAILMRRGVVKLNLCGGNIYVNPVTGKQKAVDKPEIRAAVMERFPATGGGKRPVIGIKSSPGPLYGLEGHSFDALALCLTYVDIHGRD